MKVVITTSMSFRLWKELVERLIQEDFDKLDKNEYDSEFFEENGYIYPLKANELEFRTDSILINILESLKDKGDLKIIEIPDNIKYYIESCDIGGSEVIHEEHRTWY